MLSKAVLSVLVVSVVVVLGTEEFYRIPLLYNGYMVYEDVSLNRDANTMLVVPGNLDHIPGPLKSTINLHEFNTKVVAIKNVNKGHCTIVPTHENMALADEVIYNIMKLNMTYPPNIMTLAKSNVKLTQEQLLSVGGPLVVNFCQGYSSYSAYPVKEGPTLSHRTSATGVDYVFCLISPDLSKETPQPGPIG